MHMFTQFCLEGPQQAKDLLSAGALAGVPAGFSVYKEDAQAAEGVRPWLPCLYLTLNSGGSTTGCVVIS